jgi:hypothetical protein
VAAINIPRAAGVAERAVLVARLVTGPGSWPFSSISAFSQGT